MCFLEHEGQEIPGSSGSRIPPDLGAFLAFLADVLMGVAAKRQEARKGQGQPCSQAGTCCWLRVTLGSPVLEPCGLTETSAFRKPLVCDKFRLRNTQVPLSREA